MVHVCTGRPVQDRYALINALDTRRKHTPLYKLAFQTSIQVERFLDTDSAALISMHYPQGDRLSHFGTAPFDKRRPRADSDEGADEEDQGDGPGGLWKINRAGGQGPGRGG